MATVTNLATRSQSLSSGGPLKEGELKTILEAEHPIYKKMKKSWGDLMNLYLGEKIETYIFRHQREKEQNWKRRQERAYFFNYVQSIVDLLASFIYSKSVQRNWESSQAESERVRELRNQQVYQEYQQEQTQAEAEQAQEEKDRQEQKQMMEKMGKPMPERGGKQQGGSTWGQPATPAKPPIVVQTQVEEFLQSQSQQFKELSDFWRDADLRGNSIDDYMRATFILGQVFGHVDVFVDMPTLPDGKFIETVQDRKDFSLRPYIFTIFPTDMTNWELGPDGMFNWIRWKEVVTGEVGPFQKRDERPPMKYYTWTREEWFVHVVRYQNVNASQANVELEAQGKNPLGEIPIVRFYNKRHMAEPTIGLSAVKDIGKINVEILNLSSLIDEEVYQKCVTGDTLIDCPRDLEQYPDGIPIRELVEKEFLTYAWSQEMQQLVLRKAYDVRKTGEQQEVWRLTFAYEDESRCVKLGHLDATPDHQVLLKPGVYCPLKNLQPDDVLIPWGGQTTRVVSVEFLGHEDVYNMEVEGCHNYVANGIVIHNCLNLLVMEAPANRQTAVEIGANNVLLWEGEHQPYYLAPASEPGSFMLELIKTCVQEIYRIAKLGGDTGVQEAQSGIAYTWEFNQTNRMLSDKADMMERGENELHRLWAKWMDVDWEGYVDYPDDFNVEKFEEEIDRATKLKTAVRSPQFKRLIEKKLVQRAAPKATVEDKARMYAEIEILDEEKQSFYPQF